MAIIYSYPTVTPELDDLLIGSDKGDDNATKSFTVSSLVSLINAQSGTGTVTSVTVNGDTWISSTGSPITSAGTIDIGLSASGTPSATTFLRGDNVWAEATTTNSNVSVYDENTIITADMNSLNFLGDGVIAVSDENGNVNVTIGGESNEVDSIIAGTGIGVSSSTGNVIVTNTGVTGLVAGANITLSPVSGTGVVTVNASSTGTVAVVNPGQGIKLQAGSATSDPTLGVDATGNNNYVKVIEAQTTPASDDFIPFSSFSTGDAKTTTFSAIPATAVDLIKTYIDDGDDGDVRNNTDTFTSVADVNQVITLTAAEYAAIVTPDANTLYLTTAGGGSTSTVTLAIDTSGVTGTQYTITGDQVGDSKTGVVGSAYAFSTTVPATAGYYWSVGPTINNASGSFPAVSGGVTTTISGTVSPNPPNTCIATAQFDTSGLSGYDASKVSFTATPSTDSKTCPNTLTGSEFVASANITDPNYEFTSGPTYTYPTNTINSSQDVYIVVTGTFAPKQGTVTLTLTDNINSNSGADLNTKYEVSSTNSGTAGALSAISWSSGTGTATVTGNYGQTWSITTTASAKPGYSLTPGYSPSNPLTGTIGSPTHAVAQTLSGTASSQTGTATQLTSFSITGPTAGYSAQGTYSVNGAAPVNGNTYTGAPGENVAFDYTWTLTAGYYWVNDPNANLAYSPSNTVVIVGGQNTTTTASTTGEVALITTQAFYSSSIARAASSSACSDNSSATTHYLIKGSGNFGAGPEVGDYCYTNVGGTTPCGNGFFNYGSGMMGYAYFVLGSNAGYIDSIVGPPCS